MNKLFVIYVVFLYSVLAGVSTAGSLTDNGNGTVTDSGTHLMWQQGESSLMTWEEALSYCEGLTLAGSTDWRLPNHKELHTLVDYTKATSPTINTTAFPNAPSSLYWSSTTDASSTSYAWLVLFNGGSTSTNNKTSTYYARCVRGGQ
jgi:hypothetical protein